VLDSRSEIDTASRHDANKDTSKELKGHENIVLLSFLIFGISDESPTEDNVQKTKTRYSTSPIFYVPTLPRRNEKEI